MSFAYHPTSHEKPLFLNSWIIIENATSLSRVRENKSEERVRMIYRKNMRFISSFEKQQLKKLKQIENSTRNIPLLTWNQHH